eukprot:CAMPEP_0197021476 /NCGR_PEP_ID=MMETSP1384-20130603/2363_1 /TAXON_ID=29189 /ORGANISM="Ammonia sp." /LENGTH=291 /DNA_ID=CAMNT_0042449309 /DNA_START=104 /DNA_END=979 /DNA_ORIENTATION=-
MSDRKHAAEAKTVNCYNNEDCAVICNDIFTCQHLLIYGPTDAQLNVQCIGELACTNTIFYAISSSTLNITGCESEQSCLNMSIYCPPHTKQANKHCFVEGGDNIAKGIKIYAMNGWEDIDIAFSGSSIQDGTMYCGADFDRMCKVASTEWLCVDDDECIFLDLNLNADSNSDSNGTHFVPVREDVGSLYDTVRDPAGILYVGLFLIIISLSWIVCAIIKHSLKSRARDEMIGHEIEPRVDDSSSSSGSADDDVEEDEDLQSRYGITLPNPNTPDLLFSFDDFERVPTAACE